MTPASIDVEIPDGGGIGKGGTGTLRVDGKQVAQGRIDHTIRARFPLDETMDFGEGTGTPVVEDDADRMPFRFNGKLDRFDIRLDEAKLGAADEREVSKRARRAKAARD